MDWRDEYYPGYTCRPDETNVSDSMYKSVREQPDCEEISTRELIDYISENFQFEKSAVRPAKYPGRVQLLSPSGCYLRFQAGRFVYEVYDEDFMAL